MRCSVAFLLLVGACDADPAAPPDARPRRVIDPAPYYRECDSVQPCPPPYACTTETTWHDPHGPRDVCLVPCAADDECPIDYFCKGVTTQTDIGADLHCISF